MSEPNKTRGATLPSSPDFVTQKEVAAYLCVSVAAVSQGVKNRAWPYKFLRRVWIGRRVLYTRASFLHMGREARNSAEPLPADIAGIEEGRRRSA